MSSRSPFRAVRRVYGLLLFVCAGAFATSAQAQIPVTDVAHIGINQFSWGAQYTQMYTDAMSQIDQLQTQIKTMEQQFVNGPAFQGGPGYRTNENFQRRDENANIAERCGNSAPQMPSGSERLTKIARDQFANCQVIVRMENRRYTAALDILRKLEERDEELNRLREEARNVSPDKPGELQRAQHNITQAEARLAADMENARVLMDVYEATLKAYNDDQVRLARAAYSDNAGGGTLRDIIGEAGRQVLLKAALEGIGQRNR